jgi:hypothetical protein
MSDKAFALRIILEDDTFVHRRMVQQRILDEWRQHPDTFSKYIYAIGSMKTSDVDKQILQLLSLPDFNFAPMVSKDYPDESNVGISHSGIL